MRYMARWLVLLGTVGLAVSISAAYAQEDVYYARCNLKVMDGKEITWVNWQSAPDFVPVGAKFQVTKTGKERATLVNVETKASYVLDIGASGDVYLEKFVTKTPVSLNKFSDEARENIRKTIAKVGMTKEEVYIAMGPPANLMKTRTNTMTYDQIMAGNTWVYARRRFGKNIGVVFDPATGKVTQTEGIWGKD